MVVMGIELVMWDRLGDLRGRELRDLGIQGVVVALSVAHLKIIIPLRGFPWKI